ncbi:hypothetical protein ACO0QE_002711 [Hanseniaspora vineae]
MSSGTRQFGECNGIPQQSFINRYSSTDSNLSTTTTSSIFSKDMEDYNFRLKEVENYYLSNLLEDEYIDSFTKLNLSSSETQTAKSIYSQELHQQKVSQQQNQYNYEQQTNSTLNTAYSSLPATASLDQSSYYDSMNTYNRGSVYSSIPFVNVEYQKESNKKPLNFNTFVAPTSQQSSAAGNNHYVYQSSDNGSITPPQYPVSVLSTSNINVEQNNQLLSPVSIDSEVALAQKKLQEAQEFLRFLEQQKKVQESSRNTNNINQNQNQKHQHQNQHQHPVSVPAAPRSPKHARANPQRKLEINKINKSLYKTELCESFVTTGKCRYGNKCQFAHGLSELKLKDVTDNYRTKHCSSWIKYGYCKYGNRCLFKHGDDEDIKVYLAAGTLSNGNSQNDTLKKQEQTHGTKSFASASPTTLRSSSHLRSSKRVHHNNFANVKTIKKLNESW